MAYVIFTANGDEIDRRELTAPVTIGRAQDADIPVRDILLSRTHCRLEPSRDGGHWMVVDLGSKNGTFLGYRQVKKHQLKDGDELRIGRTRVTFRGGPFEPAPPGTRRREVVRPVDPTEALAGTVAGFTLVEPGEVEREQGAPVPQPRPPEPTSYAAEDVYGMLNEIASSSWDSIKEQASRPLVMERPLPRPSAYRNAPAVARRPRVAFCLQAPAADPENATSELPASTRDPSDPPRGVHHDSPRRSWKLPVKAMRRITVGLMSLAMTVLLVGAWVLAVNQRPQATAAAALPKVREAAPELIDITFPPPEEPDARLVDEAAPAAPEGSVGPISTHLHTPNLTRRAAIRVALVCFLAVP